MITITASTIIQSSPVSVFKTLMIPPIASTGAYITILNIITVTICTCWISFVLLVINEAVENLSISVLEYDTTLLNTLFLSVIPTLAANIDASNPAKIEAIIPITAYPNIVRPFLMR